MKLGFSLFLLIVSFVDSTNAYISSVPSGGTIPWGTDKSSSVQPPSSVEVDDIFREEYHAWAKLYGKSTSDETRFENFKVNFMLQMQQNKKTGIYSHLNEFGDSKSIFVICITKVPGLKHAISNYTTVLAVYLSSFFEKSQ